MVCSVMWYDSDNHYTWLVNNFYFSFYSGGHRPLAPHGVHTLFSSKWRLAVEVFYREFIAPMIWLCMVG